jgi:hypothetical protein
MLRRASALLVPALVLLGAALLQSCANIEASGFADATDIRGNGAGGASGWSEPGATTAASAAATGGGGGVKQPPYADGSYAYLCGGSNAECMPGTPDCTPGGNPNMNSDAGVIDNVRACQLTAESGELSAKCVESGTLNNGDPCQNAAYCSATLGCVVTGTGANICRPYCCDDVEACPVDTYCAPTQMAEAPLKIPVCTPVKKCKLLDDSTCDPGQACTIVRSAGTTSCVEPGAGKRDEPCPCASGHVCSKITNACLKLCHIGNDATDCEGGTCQGGVAGYPEGIGICVAFE